MKTFAIMTLGCRVNQYESQAIREGLLKEGFLEKNFDGPCDLYIVNTCAVTGESVRKDKQILRRALRRKEADPSVVICVCGCYSQGAGEDEILRNADVVAGNSLKGSLAFTLAELCRTEPEKRKRLDLRQEIGKIREYEPLFVCRSKNARAFVKIQDGCNSFCSYCYVPLVRGRVRSRKEEDVFQEVVRLSENGYREVVLTGIETGAYGEDFNGERDLVTLVERIHGIAEIERIRFGSLKPSIFTEEFCSRLAGLSKVMPHFHLSLQSGSDRVLSAMRRKYGRKEEEASVECIYRHFPDAGLSADLICGFPGETEEDFLQTVSLVEKAHLLHTHIFPFSPREGTLAFRMKDDVAPEEKKRRCSHLLEIAKKESEAFGEKRVGKRYRILCERIRSGFAFGYTENFIYTKTKATEKMKVGEIFEAELCQERTFSVETMTVSAKSVKTVDNL